MQPDEFEDAKLLWKTFCAGQFVKQAQPAVEQALKGKLEEGI